MCMYKLKNFKYVQLAGKTQIFFIDSNYPLENEGYFFLLMFILSFPRNVGP